MEDIVFVGDWVKDRVLGSGSFGVVVLWKHKRSDEKLAIKVCKWSTELNEKHKERWTKEVEMLLKCNNPNIVGVKELPPEFIKGLAAANPSNLPILCMEYCSGGDLRQLLNKPESCSGLGELQVRQILSDVRNAVQFLHSNKITHRDLKPENIVMSILDNNVRSDSYNMNQRNIIYKLIDLGYAKEIGSNSVCASFVGTLQYLAPELMYSKTYSNSVDYWSLGLLAFELICGVRPFLPNMAPVQWMPLVKKKSSENICVYETFHNDIEYSNEIFPENYLTKTFKTNVEKWLKLALEWDPKVRGRDSPSKVTFSLPKEQKELSSKIIIFDLLKEILDKKILKVFSVNSLASFAYEITEEMTIANLKQMLYKDTKIPPQEQILVSELSYVELNDVEQAAKYCNQDTNVCVFLYSKTILIQENIEPVVPKSVQRSLEHPKALYNFNNSQTLHRNGFYFVMSQIEMYSSLITALNVRAESLRQEGKKTLVKHNTADKNIGKLITQYEILTKLVDTGKQHVQKLRESGSGLNFLGGFEKNFTDANELFLKVTKLQNAWSHLTVRMESAARRSNDITQTEIQSFITNHNFQGLYAAVYKCYTYYRKTEREYRIKEKHCHEIIKNCFDCLKLRSKLLTELRHQSFVLKLFDLSVEFSKINDIITTASENTERLITDLSTTIEDMSNCMWATISVLCGDVENLDLPYSVISFEKRDFKVGDTVRNQCDRPSNMPLDENFRNLVEESIKLRQSQSHLTDKLKSQKQLLNESIYDFSFLKD